MIVQKYELIDEVGSGSFSTVYKARHRETSQIFAIKKMKNHPHNNFEVVQNQIQMLKKIQHKNIIKYETDFKDKGNWYIVFQFCGKGDLETFHAKKQILPETFCKNFAFSLISVLELLHSQKIVHRDLKLANILINDNYEFKLADFGFSRDNQIGIMQSFCGTPYAMSPQILNREGYDEKCDTWSLGVMIYQLIYGKLPFMPSKSFGAGIIGLANCIINSQPKYDLNSQISAECIDFIKVCLIKNKSLRPRMSELKKHAWVNSGISSRFPKEYIMDNFEQKNEVKNRIEEIFNGAVAQHVRKIIEHFKLSERKLKENSKQFDVSYKKNGEIKNLNLWMIMKKINELQSSIIEFNISDKKFILSLKNVNSFKNHIENLKEFLNYSLKDKKEPAHIEKRIIQFLADEAEICVNENESYPEKMKLIYQLSELPLKKPIKSVIQASWSFNEDRPKTRMQFQEYLEGIKTDEIEAIINGEETKEDLKRNWLIDHKFVEEERENQEIQIGLYINAVLRINTRKFYDS